MSIVASLVGPVTGLLDKFIEDKDQKAILGIWVAVPEVDTTLLVPVMMGMLGLGAMRSYEKVNKVAREK